MKKYYMSAESNSVCVWSGGTGECVYQISRYVDGYTGECVYKISRYAYGYTGYEQAKKKCEELNKGE